MTTDYAANLLHEKARETLQKIMQVLGPESVTECMGCRWEMNEAIRLLKSAGIEYQQRRRPGSLPYKSLLRYERRTKPAHDPAAERRGNEIAGTVETVTDEARVREIARDEVQKEFRRIEDAIQDGYRAGRWP